MSLFHHPHLTRGILRTPKGSFVISRGLVDVPDELGESLGWRPAETEEDALVTVSRSASPARDVSDQRQTP